MTTTYEVGQPVEFAANGTWYPGTVTQLGKTNITVEYVKGSGQTYTQSVNPTAEFKGGQRLGTLPSRVRPVDTTPERDLKVAALEEMNQRVTELPDPGASTRRPRQSTTPKEKENSDRSAPQRLEEGKDLDRLAKALTKTEAGTDEQTRAMVAMRSAGASYSQMAAAMGVVPMTARARYLKVTAQG
jgi:hypothetical protein